MGEGSRGLGPWQPKKEGGKEPAKEASGAPPSCPGVSTNQVWSALLGVGIRLQWVPWRHLFRNLGEETGGWLKGDLGSVRDASGPRSGDVHRLKGSSRTSYACLVDSSLSLVPKPSTVPPPHPAAPRALSTQPGLSALNALPLVTWSPPCPTLPALNPFF